MVWVGEDHCAGILKDGQPVLNRKRALTLKMIRRLHKGLGIPAESLIGMDDDEAA